MPKFIIERDLPGVGNFTSAQLKDLATSSCGVLHRMGPHIQWNQSFVTGDKLYCVYIAPDMETVRQHATIGGFPANRISEVIDVIDPTTAE